MNIPIIPMWAKAIALTIALGAAGSLGYTIRDRDYQRHLKADAEASLKASEAVRKVEAKNEETSQEIGQEVEAAKESIRYVTRTIIKEVPTYVTQEAADRCVVPDGAVRLLDAAATGNTPVPYAPGESPDAASGIGLPEVVSTVVENYGYTRELEATVTGWQDWYKQVLKDWPTQ